MSYDYLNVIGLMSGTSMDGIDISFVKTNGINIKRLSKNYYFKYTKDTKNLLIKTLNKNFSLDDNKLRELNDIIAFEHYLALKDLKILKSCDLVGFHGQTIYHNPFSKISIQLGNAKQLAKMINKNVISNFRERDLLFGGQGAPIAPIYHKLIMEQLKLELPSSILNIGGVSNLTFWNGKDLIGFDTGPGNALMDDYMRKHQDRDFDENGDLASKGIPNKNLVSRYLQNAYFRKFPPKSLDRNSFKDFYCAVLKKSNSPEDIMATLAEFTIESIIFGINLLNSNIKSLIITGGGYRNNYLIKKLSQRMNTKILNEKNINLNFDFIESELIAFLSARSIYNLPFTFPSTTGVLKPVSGGDLYECL